VLLQAAKHSAGWQELPAAGVAGLAASELPQAARHSAAPRELPAAAGVADFPAPARQLAAPHAAACLGEFVPVPEAARGAPERVGSVPPGKVHEVLGRAAFAEQVARRGAAVVAEQVARWPAPVVREVRWRLAGAAGLAPRGPVRLEPASGPVAAYLCRLPGAQHLARGEFRLLWIRTVSAAGSRRQQSLRYKAEGNCVSLVPRPVG